MWFDEFSSEGLPRAEIWVLLCPERKPLCRGREGSLEPPWEQRQFEFGLRLTVSASRSAATSFTSALRKEKRSTFLYGMGIRCSAGPRKKTVRTTPPHPKRSGSQQFLESRFSYFPAFWGALHPVGARQHPRLLPPETKGKAGNGHALALLRFSSQSASRLAGPRKGAGWQLAFFRPLCITASSLFSQYRTFLPRISQQRPRRSPSYKCAC